MNRIKIIIDCDPGQDDAVMLLMALASPEELDVLAITTVAGNVPLHLTARNARLMCELANRTDVPVFAGCDKPLQRPLTTAEYVHGRTGIDGATIYEPELPLQTEHAVDYIIDTLVESRSDPVTLVVTGPMTNIASALKREPSVRDGIKEIVVMGGAMREGGNATPSAEFNIYVDPHAAEIVFGCGRPITLAGLDLTHQAIVTVDFLHQLRQLDTSVARDTLGMLEFFNHYDTEKYHLEGAPLHDPCTIAYLLNPQLFNGKKCNVEVETQSNLTVGHTAIDFWQVTDKEPNVNWLHQIDSAGFFDLLLSRLARLNDRATES